LDNIIINADDFGLSSSVNSAIIDSFARGFINSTTLMSNMPAFADAVELAYKHQITDRIGVHLNLDEGDLLTSAILKTSLSEKKNLFGITDKRSKLFFISQNEKNLIYKEFSAQIERVTKAGIRITHLDTHHHIHEIGPITLIILALLKEYKISSMRILNNLNNSTTFYKSGYRLVVNEFIKKSSANFSDYFGNQFEAIEFCKLDKSFGKGKKLEIMVHPDYNEKGIIIDKIKNQEYSFENLSVFLKCITI
jgi:predicted glycoside hydrolase/deacetylase ChbG (UPF0249 family)